MRFIWSLEYIEGKDWKKQLNFLKKSVTSVVNHIHSVQNLFKVLYISENILESLETLGIIKMFDEINIIHYSDFKQVNPKIFWANSKLRSLLREEEPVTFIDNDFFFTGDIHSMINLKKTCYSFTESCAGLYPNSLDPKIRNLKLPWRIRKYAANSSFLYFPDKEIMHEYAKLSLTVMNSLSEYKNLNTKYLLFAEQSLLYSFLQEYNIDYQCLSRDIWINYSQTWKRDSEPLGIFSETEQKLYYNHLGPNK